MADLAGHLRHRALAVLGDSLSFQITESMRCAAASVEGGVHTVRLQARAPESMRRTCRFLMSEAGRERPCGCHASADKAWRNSACGVWRGPEHLDASNGTFTATAFHMPSFNFTFFYDFDGLNKYVYLDRCYVRRRGPSRATSRPRYPELS